jgi:hypothetical protein
MLAESALRILERVSDSDLVLDVGGWGRPFPRADWVIDLMPYESRGVYGADEAGRERFSEATWIERDVCARARWPFEDGQFEFAICSHTLEDVRDPVWVCDELNRVARAGYIEVPSRLEEQAWGVAGDWVGWSHHHWLVDVGEAELSFVLKPHVIHARPEYYFPEPLGALLTEPERVATMFWEGGFSYSERIFFEHAELDDYLAGFVREHRARLEERVPKGSSGGRIRRALRRARPDAGAA